MIALNSPPALFMMPGDKLQETARDGPRKLRIAECLGKLPSRDGMVDIADDDRGYALRHLLHDHENRSWTLRASWGLPAAANAASA